MWLNNLTKEINSQQPTEKTTTLFKGRIIEVIQKEIDGRTFEIARRSPGVRLIIKDWKKILLTKEYRHEHNAYDYRLPGGKVFDSLDEYNEKMENNEDLETYAGKAAKNEAKQEAWVLPQSLQLLSVNKAWATIERDLYYFLVEKFEVNTWGQELEEWENITTEWKTFEEVQQLCLDWSIKEDRSVWMLLKFLLNQ